MATMLKPSAQKKRPMSDATDTSGAQSAGKKDVNMKVPVFTPSSMAKGDPKRIDPNDKRHQKAADEIGTEIAKRKAAQPKSKRKPMGFSDPEMIVYQ